jgi:hypothetical protein
MSDQNFEYLKMDPVKKQFLEQMSNELKSKKQDEILPFLLAVTTAANQRGISFSDKEAELIIDRLYPNQTPEEQKRIQQLKLFAKMLSSS